MPDPTTRPTTQTTSLRPPRFVDELWRAVALDRLEKHRSVVKARAVFVTGPDEAPDADWDAPCVAAERPARVVPSELRAAAVLELERRVARVPEHVDELAHRLGRRPGLPSRSKVGPKPASRGNRPSKRERDPEWSVQEIEAVGELPSAVDLAWAAGLFAGEGYCGAIPRGKHKYLSAQVQMLDEQSIRRFAGIFGRSVATFRLHYDESRFVYRVIAGGRPAEQMLAAMWPYLVGTAKGDQIQAAAEEVGVFGWIDGSATEERPARLNGNQWSGKKHTPETKAKMAAARRAYWARRRGELA